MTNLLYSDNFLNDSRTSGLIININNIVLVNYYKPISDFRELISSSYIEGDRSRVSIKDVESIKNDSKSIQLSFISNIDITDKCLLYFYYYTDKKVGEKLGGVLFNSSNPGTVLKIMSGVNNLVNIPLKDNLLANLYTNETNLDLKFLEGNGFREGINAFSNEKSEEPITTYSYDKLISINNLYNTVEKNLKNDKYQVGYWNSLDKFGKFVPRYFLNNTYSDLSTTIYYSDGTIGEVQGKSITTDELSGNLILLGNISVKCERIYEYGDNSDILQKLVSTKDIPIRVDIDSDKSDLKLSYDQKTGILKYQSEREGNFKIISKITYSNLNTNEIIELKSEVGLIIGKTNSDWEILTNSPSYLEKGKNLYMFSNPEIGNKIEFTIKTTTKTVLDGGIVEYGDGFDTWFEVSTNKVKDDEITVTITVKKKNESLNQWAPIINNESLLIPCSIRFLDTEVETFYCIQEPVMNSLDLYDINEDGVLKKIEENNINIKKGSKYSIYPALIDEGSEGSNNYWFVLNKSNDLHIFPNKGVLNNTLLAQNPKDEYYKTDIIGKVNSELIFYRVSGETPDNFLDSGDWRKIINIPKKSLSVNVISEDSKNFLEVSAESIEIDRYGIYQFSVNSSSKFSLKIEKKVDNEGFYVKFIDPETNSIIDGNEITSDSCENKEFFIVANPISKNVEEGFCDIILSLVDESISKRITLSNHTYSYSKFFEIYKEPSALSFSNEYLVSGDYSGAGTILLTNKWEKICYITNIKLGVNNEIGEEVEVSDIIDIFDCSKLNINRGYVRSEVYLKLKNEPEIKTYPTKEIVSGKRLIIYPKTTEEYPDDIRYLIAPKKESPNIYLDGESIKNIYLTEVGDKVNITVHSNYPLTNEDLNYPINIIKSNIISENSENGIYTIELTLIKSVKKNYDLGNLLIKKLITPNSFYYGYSVNKEVIDNILSDQKFIQLNIKSTGKGNDYSISGNFNNIDYFGESRVFYINFEEGVFNKNLGMTTTSTNYSTIRSDINSRKINLTAYSRLLGYNKPYQVDNTDGYIQLSKSRNIGFNLNIFNKNNPGTILYNENISIPQEKLQYGILIDTYNGTGGLLFVGKDSDTNNIDLHVEPDVDSLKLCIGDFPTSSKIVENSVGYINNLDKFKSSSESVILILSDSEKIYYSNSKNATIYFPKNNSLNEIITKISISDLYGNNILLNLTQDPIDFIYKTTVKDESTIKFDYLGNSIYTDSKGEVLKILDPEVETNIPIDQLEVKSATLVNPKIEFIKTGVTNNNTSIYKVIIKVDPHISTDQQPLIGTIEILYKNNTIWRCIGVQESINIKLTTRLGVTYNGTIIGSAESPIHTPAINSGTLSSERQYFKLSASVWKIILSPDGSYESSEESITECVKLTGYNWTLGEDNLNTFSERETKLLYSDLNIPSGFPILENVYSVSEDFIEKEVPYIVEVYLAMLSTENLEEGNYLPKITMYLQKDKKTVTSKVRKKK